MCFDYAFFYPFGTVILYPFSNLFDKSMVSVLIVGTNNSLHSYGAASKLG